MSVIINAAPQVIFLGAQDNSARTVTPTPLEVPQHLPKFAFFAERGPTVPMPLEGGAITSIYGDETINPDGIFYNHATRFMVACAGAPNLIMAERVVPADAGIPANIAVYIDLLKKKVPNYARNSDGSYVVEGASYKIDGITPEIDGYEFTFVTDYTTESNYVPGVLTSKTGTLVNTDDVQVDDIEITVVDSVTYTVTVNGNPYTFDSGVGTDLSTIQAGLIAAITEAGITVTTSATGITLTGDVAGVTFTTSVGENLTLTNTVVLTSTMYPIFEFQAAEQGAWYNNLGFAISSLLENEINTDITSVVKALIYRLSIVTKDGENVTPTVTPSLFGEQSVNVVLKDKTKNPITSARFDMGYVFENSWYNTDDITLSLRYPEFDKYKIYYDNIKTISDLIMANEVNHLTADLVVWDDTIESDNISWYDYISTDTSTIAAEESLLINILTGTSSKGVKYYTFIKTEETPTLTGNQSETAISSTTPIYLKGGTNGTMNETTFETAVGVIMDGYNNPDSKYMDLAINLESTFWDSGFSTSFKNNYLMKFISVRKDTFLALSTHSDNLGESYLTLSEHRAIAAALMTRLELYPESTHFGTHVSRAIIVGGSGIVETSGKQQIPQTYDLMMKVARFMGASNGKWNPLYRFDSAANNNNNVINTMKKLQPDFIPDGVKPALWKENMIWSQPFDRVQFFFPATQTVYNNDTSVLNTLPVNIVMCTVNKLAFDAWKTFTGSLDPEDIFVDNVTSFMQAGLKDKFAKMYTVIPEVIITDIDRERGYSWKLKTNIYGSNAKTVMVAESAVFRASDLEA